MSSKLYVGNLPYSVTSKDLEDIFNGIGRVHKATVIMDRETGRSKGFGFVEMDNPDLAREAKEKMDRFEWQGRFLKVSEANEREPKRQGATASEFR